MDIRAIAHLGRFREIVTTLVKYGFDDVVDRLDVPGRKYLEKIRVHTMHLTRWERMRMVLEELGPTFIKCGQILSQRADLLPRELLEELRKLQDDVPAEEFSEIRKVLQDNFAQPLEDIFSEIEETPIAAASLAQVHKAWLKGSNQEVALKIQRPDIAETIKSDMDILERIAIRLDGRMESFKVYNLPQLVQRIRKLMLQELNFAQEMRNMQVVRTHTLPEEKILIPEVYPELCGELVITMELSRGSKMKDVRVSELKNRASLAKRGLNFSIRQVLEQGFFHADPHPGNILIDEDENMILLDWGMVGRLTNKVRYELIDLIGAVVDNDVEEVTEILISFTTGRENVNRGMLQNEVLEVVSHFTRLPLKEVNLGQLLMELTTLLRNHGRILTTDLSIMIKALVTAEGTARMLYPDLDVIKEAEPMVRRMSKNRFSPSNLLKGLQKNIRYLMRFQYELPRQTMDIISKLDRGELAIRFQHQNLEGLQSTLERVVNRLVVGIVTGALFLGSGMIIMADTGPRLWGYPALGVVGYIIAVFLSLRLVMAMVRSRKR
ncbi:ABC-1 domain protein [Desulfonatronospira thiodismutans ASO3-1]|uniref:ABC-1 domain protein n=1 Tax=Desulfonatronospira thiodismutans ASO3-1 TaxID=555779 RepID=D6SUQ7_9BACT|nr:AarF/UbiB family protein [Desulfonatronospira thiodismutans]EFI33037.1 ABC-1 domain protein [Desulfonatronospira thiodismutans ASO3-1]